MGKGKTRKSAYHDEVQGFSLDLSLRGLETIKVVELALLPLVTTIDLSKNRLITLPEEFGTLSHLVRLDLSYNLLQTLPESFGNLVSLRHLDLYSNKIKRLPWSFSQLDDLVWLDVSSNPIDPTFIPSDIAGQALATRSDKECKDCAKRVVAHMKEKVLAREKKQEKEHRKAEKLAEQERERAQLTRAEEARKKKEEKEKRKREAEVQRAALLEAARVEEESKGEYVEETDMSGATGWIVGVAVVVGLIALIFAIIIYLMPDDFPRLLMDWLGMIAGGASWWD